MKFKNTKGLINESYIWQGVGGLFFTMLFINFDWYYKLLFFVILMISIIRIFKMAKRVVEVVKVESSRLTVLTLGKKKKVFDGVKYEKSLEGIVILNRRNVKLFEIVKFDWEEYELLSSIVFENLKQGKEQDSLIKEIIIDEITDPSNLLNGEELSSK